MSTGPAFRAAAAAGAQVSMPHGAKAPPRIEDEDTTDGGSDPEAQISEGEGGSPRGRAPALVSTGRPRGLVQASRPPGNWTAGRVQRPTVAPPTLLATMRPDLAPQKVSLPHAGPARLRPLDPAVPAKKKPLLCWAEGCAWPAPDPGAPLKKRVTDFFVQDAQRVLAAPAKAS